MKKLIAAGLSLLMIAGPGFAAEPRKTGEYPLTQDSFPQPGVAKGQIIGPLEFRSKIIPGNTVRRYWIYVPAGYNAANPPNLLVWQDGMRAVPDTTPLRIPIVLDNLIAKKEIAPTLGIFITPGNTGTEHYPDNLGTGNPNHRAQEYDEMSDDYSQFLIQEMLPEVAKTYKFSSDPAKRAIGGTSSGAICSFTVAWHHPDQFGNIISMIGSYTSIGYHPATATTPEKFGGDTYPGLIRRAPPKKMKIYLEDGTNDLDNQFGNWHLANMQMLSSLQWANSNADTSRNEAVKNGPRYDIRFEWGDGPHSDVHGGWLLPGILRWMFAP
jgi:enterochelin esterase family protein